jgi:hypothetical protein
MAPPERRDLAEMSSGQMPRAGPMAVTAMRRAAVMRAGVTLSHAIVEGIEGRYTGCLQPAEVSDATDKSVDGADDGAARAAEAHKLAEHPVLSSGELQGNKGGGV